MSAVPSSSRLTYFGEWLQRRGINYADAGTALNVTRQHVHLLATGQTAPSLALANRIATWAATVDPSDVVDSFKWKTSDT